MTANGDSYEACRCTIEEYIERHRPELTRVGRAQQMTDVAPPRGDVEYRRLMHFILLIGDGMYLRLLSRLCVSGLTFPNCAARQLLGMNSFARGDP